MTGQTTDFVHFDRIGDGTWKVRCRLSDGDLTVDIALSFRRDANAAIWAGERLAMQQAHEAIGEWLQAQKIRDASRSNSP